MCCGSLQDTSINSPPHQVLEHPWTRTHNAYTNRHTHTNTHTQIASLVNALSLLGWRPPTSFWPSLYASLASRQAGRKDFVSVPALKGSSAAAKRSSRSAGPAQTSTSVLLALAKYSSMAAAVDEAEAAAAALRSESAAASLVSAADTPVDVANDQQSPAVDVGQQHKTEQQQSTQQQQGQEGASQNDQFILPPSAVVHRLLDQVSGEGGSVVPLVM